MFFFQSFSLKEKLSEVIYSFHIPLFFFLSGVLFKPEQDLNYLVMRKADSVLKPYFVVLSLLSLVLVVRFVIVTHPAAASLLTIIGYSVHVLSCIIGYFFQIIYGIGNLLPLGLGGALVSSSPLGAFYFFICLSESSQIRSSCPYS